MIASCSDTEGKIAVATLPRRWQMLGVHGQRIGSVEACGIDLDSGRMRYLVLATALQTISVPWERVRLDRDNKRFQLVPPVSDG